MAAADDHRVLADARDELAGQARLADPRRADHREAAAGPSFCAARSAARAPRARCAGRRTARRADGRRRLRPQPEQPPRRDLGVPPRAATGAAASVSSPPPPGARLSSPIRISPPRAPRASAAARCTASPRARPPGPDEDLAGGDADPARCPARPAPPGSSSAARAARSGSSSRRALSPNTPAIASPAPRPPPRRAARARRRSCGEALEHGVQRLGIESLGERVRVGEVGHDHGDHARAPGAARRPAPARGAPRARGALPPRAPPATGRGRAPGSPAA